MKTLNVYRATGEQIWTAPFKDDASLLAAIEDNSQRGFRCVVIAPPPEPEPRIYRIIRFNRTSDRKRTIRNNVTLTEAQAHCHRDDTKGHTWFDGYEYMKGCAPKKA